MKWIYKTEAGYFKYSSSKYCSIEKFFNDEIFHYKKNNSKQVYHIASYELKSIIADRLINRIFEHKTKSDKGYIKNALINKRCDLSYFQSFYTSGGNSLSGSSYNYCKRMFLKSIY